MYCLKSVAMCVWNVSVWMQSSSDLYVCVWLAVSQSPAVRNSLVSVDLQVPIISIYIGALYTRVTLYFGNDNWTLKLWMNKRGIYEGMKHKVIGYE